MARSLQDRLREVQERGQVDVATQDEIASAAASGGALAITPAGVSLKARLQALIDQQVGRRRAEVEQPSYFELDSADPGITSPRPVDVYNL